MSRTPVQIRARRGPCGPLIHARLGDRVEPASPVESDRARRGGCHSAGGEGCGGAEPTHRDPEQVRCLLNFSQGIVTFANTEAVGQEAPAGPRGVGSPCAPESRSRWHGVCPGLLGRQGSCRDGGVHPWANGPKEVVDALDESRREDGRASRGRPRAGRFDCGKMHGTASARHSRWGPREPGRSRGRGISERGPSVT